MSTITHEISHSPAWLAKLLKQLHAGDEFILTQNGRHLVRLVSVEQEDVKEQRHVLVAHFQKSVATKVQHNCRPTA